MSKILPASRRRLCRSERASARQSHLATGGHIRGEDRRGTVWRRSQGKPLPRGEWWVWLNVSVVSVYLPLSLPDQCVIYCLYWVWPPVSVESVCLPSLPWLVNKHSSLGNRRHSHLPLFHCHGGKLSPGK